MRLWLPRLRKQGPFEFLEPGTLLDRELELVEPSPRWIDPMLLTTHSAACATDACATMSRSDVLRFVERFPRGREMPNPFRNRAPSYTFWMRLRRPILTDSSGGRLTVPVEIAGTISLRIGDTEDLRLYLGHVGYGVYPPARGRRLAERSTRLLLPFARAHGLRELWVTANPENAPSRRTCERLGAELVDVVELPLGHPLYLRGDRRKCRYRIDLTRV